jgi:hypothetical protein
MPREPPTSREDSLVVVEARWMPKELVVVEDAHPQLAFASEEGGVGAGRRFMVAGCRSSK